MSAGENSVGPQDTASGRPTLLIHGLGVDHRMWTLQEPALCDLGPVWAPDLPGFGGEPPLPSGRRKPEALADWLGQWLQDRDAPAVDVAGYSMGGSLALLLALRYPERVASVAACCTSPCWGIRGRGLLARVFTGVGGRLSVEIFLRSVLWGFSRHSRNGDHRAEVEDMVERADRGSMFELYRALSRLDLRPDLQRIDVPVLAVAGSRDWLAPPSHARILTRAVEGAELRILQGADHILCLGRAEALSALLADFFRRCRAGRSARGSGAGGIPHRSP